MQWRIPKKQKRLEYVRYEEKLKELGLFNLRRRRLK